MTFTLTEYDERKIRGELILEQYGKYMDVSMDRIITDLLIDLRHYCQSEDICFDETDQIAAEIFAKVTAN